MPDVTAGPTTDELVPINVIPEIAEFLGRHDAEGQRAWLRRVNGWCSFYSERFPGAGPEEAELRGWLPADAQRVRDSRAAARVLELPVVTVTGTVEPVP